MKGSMGSPPPMRGKGRSKVKHRGGRGITPAYAGKSLQDRTGTRKKRDHPRLCGEKFVSFSKFVRVLGSPPPMRGKDLRRAAGVLLMRITPAYAGKSPRRTAEVCNRQDHPRLCGEKVFFRWI